MKVSKRWLPAAVVPAVIAAAVLSGPIQANAIDLPDLTPQQLMLLMERDAVTGFSGTVIKRSDLGLPALEMSSMMSQDMADKMQEKMPEGFEEFVPALIERNTITQALELLAGTHRVRIYASAEGFRAQILDPMSQRDIVLNKDEFWTYDAKNAFAQTGSIEQLGISYSEQDKKDATAMGEEKINELATKLQLDLSNPEAVADMIMAEVSKTSTVTVGKDHRAAGRDAYQVIVEPKSSNSLFKDIKISVDAETGMALDLKVYSVEQEESVFEIGFESISFETPNSSLFSFVPPAGTTVERMAVPAELSDAIAQAKKIDPATIDTAKLNEEELKNNLEAALAKNGAPKLIGAGWDSVVSLDQIPAEVPMEMLETELLADLLKKVDGGRVFSTPIFNVLITDSGKVFAGSVNIAFLVELSKK